MSERLFEPSGEWQAQNLSSNVKAMQTSDEFTSSRLTDHSDESDKDLVTKAKSGDHAAFGELCRRCSRVVKQRVYRIVRNHHDAEDIFQDTVLKAYTHVGSFRGSCSFTTWVTCIAFNSALMHLRKKSVRREVSAEFATAEGNRGPSWNSSDPFCNPEQLYQLRQTALMLSQALKKLPPGFRQILEQQHEQEIRLADAAKELGITVAAAKSRLFRARKLLRHRLNVARAG